MKEIHVVNYEIYKKNGVVVLTGCFWQRSKSKIRIKIHVTAAADPTSALPWLGSCLPAAAASLSA